MAATTRFAAAIAALSAVVSASPFDYPSCQPTTTTVYQTVTVPFGYKETGAAKGSTSPSQSYQNSPLPGLSYPGVSFPTYSPEKPNPNGPVYNPNDYIPEPVTWPGIPTKSDAKPPPRPTAPYKPGGQNGGMYQSPAWNKKGSDLTPAMSQKGTNGDSIWGTLQCPRVPPYNGPGSGTRPAKASSSGSGKGASQTKSAAHGSTLSSVVKPSGSASFSGVSHSGSPITASGSASVPLSTGSSFPSLTSSGLFGNGTNSTLQACGPVPDTGVTVTYDFTVSLQQIAPDGVVKNGLVVNGAFPGPLITANWGDWIEVTVHNSLPDEGTSLHWHGLLQTGTPFMDGVPSVSQCPIPPGGSFTYRFRADQYGSSWYHSHYSAQYSGGALGPIVINGPKTVDYDEDVGPVMLSDWYHKDYFSIVEETMNGTIPLSNNNLINGKMNYPCANTTLSCTPNAGISKFSFQSGKKYRLRLINTSAEGIQKFTIDGHNMTVIANDFVPINPYSTNVVTLGVGQRSDVVVEAVGTSGSAYWMRSELGNAQDPNTPGCSFSDGISTQAVAAVYYENADTNSLPTTSPSWTSAQLSHCGNDDLSLTTPLCPIVLDTPGTVETVDITFGSNGTNFVWFMNNSTFRGDYNVDLLSHVNSGNMTFEPEWNVFNFGSNSSVRIIIENHFFVSHPMHLHGHNFHVLAEGLGTWDGTVTNPSNTQRRDVQLMQPGLTTDHVTTTTPSYIVLQWTQDNPAVWPLHCHIAWHVSGGLYINVLERPDDIKKMTIPQSSADTCAAWGAWTNSHIPDQIDSGL